MRLVVFLSFVLSVYCWTRYEKRYLHCPPDSLQCVLEFPGRNGWNKTIECHLEDIPGDERTKLNQAALKRVACPLGCRPHIIQKESARNRKCAPYSTFGKYQKKETEEWFIWFCEPCRSTFNTDCDFQE